MRLCVKNDLATFLNFVTRYDIVPRISLTPLSAIEQQLQQVLDFFNPKFTSKNMDQVPGFFVIVMENASCVASYAACNTMGSTNLLLETLSSFIKLSPYTPLGTYVFCIDNRKLVVERNPDAILQILFNSSQLSTVEEKVDQCRSDRARLCISTAKELEKQKLRNQAAIDEKKRDIEEKIQKLEASKSNCELSKSWYYDVFKISKDEEDFHGNLERLELAGTWDEIIEILKPYKLPDEFECQEARIDLGTRYRCVVEPLDIANYYRHLKNEDTGPYMLKGRPKRAKERREHAGKTFRCVALSCWEPRPFLSLDS
ncbi:hypothetical protein POTOM_042031 [Populus tomentosa]|uniref:EDS1 EP domain-containing protein n=1 Tax=Populus tomentosa TaxID=118781 RepID=A0A8X7YSZ3_POPTO|nr:hypothetical protein POTOM_042031 [Populus tomentosa]